MARKSPAPDIDKIINLLLTSIFKKRCISNELIGHYFYKYSGITSTSQVFVSLHVLHISVFASVPKENPSISLQQTGLFLCRSSEELR